MAAGMARHRICVTDMALGVMADCPLPHHQCVLATSRLHHGAGPRLHKAVSVTAVQRTGRRARLQHHALAQADTAIEESQLPDRARPSLLRQERRTAELENAVSRQQNRLLEERERLRHDVLTQEQRLNEPLETLVQPLEGRVRELAGGWRVPRRTAIEGQP